MTTAMMITGSISQTVPAGRDGRAEPTVRMGHPAVCRDVRHRGASALLEWPMLWCMAEDGVGRLLGRVIALSLLTLAAVAPSARAAAPDPATFAHQASSPITLSSDPTDRAPGVAVDTDGTAYVVWEHNAPATGNTIKYCRLPPGAPACDKTLTFAPNAAADSIFSDVRVLLPSAGHPLITFSAFHTTTNVYVIQSADGGTTFNAPPAPIHGTGANFGSAAPGPEANSFSTLTSSSSTDVRYQEITYGGFVNHGAAVLPDQTPGTGFHKYYEGGLGLINSTTPIAAYSGDEDLAETHPAVYWRAYNPANGTNYGIAADWKPERKLVDEEDPRLTSLAGGGGVFLQSRVNPSSSAAHYVVRHYNAGADTFDGPVSVSDSTFSVASSQLSEDAGGGLHSVWYDNGLSTSDGSFDSPLRYAYSPDGGLTWYRRTLEDTTAHNIPNTQIGVAANGGGLVVHSSTAGGITADVIRPATAGGFDPPPPPLGGGGGTSPPAPPPPPAPCQTTTVAPKVLARTAQGCLTAAGKDKLTTSSDLRVNGIDFLNSGHKTISVNTSAHTISAPDGVIAQAGAIVLNDKGSVTWDLDHSTSFTGLAKSGIKLLGFAVSGDASVTFPKLGEANVKVNIELPFPFSNVTAAPVLHTTMDANLTLDGLHLHVDSASVGGFFEINNLNLDYIAAGDKFNGSADVALPAVGGPASKLLHASIGFQGGTLDHLDLNYDGPPLPLPIGPAINLTEVGFHTAVNKGLDLGGSVQLIAGEKVPILGVTPVQVDGALNVHIPADSGPVTVGATGAFKLVGIPFGHVSAVFSTTPTFTFNGDFDLPILKPLLSAEITTTGYIGIKPPGFYAGVNVSVCVPASCGSFLTFSSEGAISSKGLGVCKDVGISKVKVSLGVVWPWKEGPSPYLTGCQSALKNLDIGTFRRASIADAGGRRTFTLPASPHLDQLDLVVQGQGGIPNITVTRPDGQAITVGVAAPGQPVQGPDGMIGFGVPAISPAGYAAHPAAAVVLIGDPKPGKYTITPNPGSVPITGVQDAQGTPLPTTSGSVGSGAGTRASASRASKSRVKSLRYRIGPTGGHPISLYEIGASGVLHALGPAKAGRHTLRFTIADGPAGARKVVASIQDAQGVPLQQRTLATFVAPGPITPATPHVKAKRSGTTLKVSWHRPGGAARYVAQVNLSDGRRVQIPTKHTSVKVSFVGSTLTGSVSVRAFSANGRQGKAGTAKLRKPATKKKHKKH